MKQYCDTLKNAIELGAVPTAINALICIAETLAERGDHDRAVEILALVVCYKVGDDAREAANSLYSELKTMVCPRVVVDAEARADEMTLDDLALEVIGEMAEE
jgi:hypothetical protein